MADVFATIPTEVIPAMLSTPKCVVAARLTCRRFRDEIPPTLFKRKTATSWGSDYWTVCIVTTGDIAMFERFQNNRPDVVYKIPNGGATWASAKYVLTYYTEDTPTFIYMSSEIGIDYVEDRQNIYYLVGRFSGGPVSRDSIIASAPRGRMEPEALAVFEVPFKHRGKTCGCFASTFEYLSRFIDVTESVAIFRRR
jgi:hypothetical protein